MSHFIITGTSCSSIRYLLVIEASLEIPSLYFYFRSALAKLIFPHISRIHTCSDPLIAIAMIAIAMIAIANITTDCEYVIMTLC